MDKGVRWYLEGLREETNMRIDDIVDLRLLIECRGGGGRTMCSLLTAKVSLTNII